MSPRPLKILALLTVAFTGFFVAAMAVTHGYHYSAPAVGANAWNGTNSRAGTSAVGSIASSAIPVAFAQLLPPLYRTVTGGDAWVFDGSGSESGTGGLSARGLGCECFNPQNECCLPSNPSLAPYCMPVGSVCCGNTFCVEGETCCGDFCCAASTTCNLHAPTGSGCCPQNTLCTSPPVCYDHFSPNCTSSTPKQHCCPASLPYCRDFTPGGLGCYAMNTTSSSTSSFPTGVNSCASTVTTTEKSIAGVSAAPTTNVLASMLSAALFASNPSASLPSPSASPSTIPSTSSSTVTITVSVLSNSKTPVVKTGLAFPSLGSKETGVTTTYMLASTTPTSSLSSIATTSSTASHSPPPAISTITGGVKAATGYKNAGAGFVECNLLGVAGITLLLLVIV